MYVALSVLKNSLAVTPLMKRDGRLVSTGNVVNLQPNSKLGHVPYERLRILGDGVHELSEDARAVFWTFKEVVHIPWAGWLFFAVVAAASALLGYWFFANWEAEGGRIRIHWFVAAVYAFGGKWAVSGAFGAASVFSLGQCVRTWITGTRRLVEKRHRLAENLAGIMDATCRITVDEYDTLRGLHVCYGKGLLRLFLPVDHLTSAEEKRAQKLLGPPESGQPDPEFPEATAPDVFAVELGTDPTAAAEQIIDVMMQVYRLHPYFELDIHSCTSWSEDDEDAWSELDDDRSSPAPPSPVMV